MTASSFTYRLVSVGVNHTHDAPPLSYAESGAREIASALASGLGPVHPANATVLPSGRRRATVRELDLTLKREAGRRPHFFAFYFGGHGNRVGIQLADDFYPFSRLRDRIARIGARATVVMLNSCEAGGFASGAVISGLGDAASLSAAWGAQLLAAVPGTRVFMAGAADASTYELPQIGGVYAYALMQAMQMPAPGDLSVLGKRFVSDRLLFERAAAVMREYGLTPIAAGTFGGFPMVLANDHPIGGTEFASITPIDGVGLDVALVVHDRRFLATQIVATATDALGNRFAAQHALAVPRDSETVITARFAANTDLSLGCTQQLWQFGTCRVAWNVAVLDGHGRLLDQARYVAEYGA